MIPPALLTLSARRFSPKVKPAMGRWVFVFVTLCAMVGAQNLQGQTPQLPGAVLRGEYIFRMAGGCGCHTNRPAAGQFMAGGRPVKTPFGVFYSTNLTPHREQGLGGWNAGQFITAMRSGIGPGGIHYFPVFPFTSFNAMKEADLRDLKTYLDSLPASPQANKPHALHFPFGWRGALLPWRWLFFRPAPIAVDPARTASWNRGAYIVKAVAHCGECHTPRNLAGGLRADMWMAGSVDGPEGALAPNITPHEETGIGAWDRADIVYFLQIGLKPDGDDAQDLMAEAIEHGYAHLTDTDLGAIADYLLTLEPVENEIRLP